MLILEAALLHTAIFGLCVWQCVHDNRTGHFLFVSVACGKALAVGGDVGPAKEANEANGRSNGTNGVNVSDEDDYSIPEAIDTASEGLLPVSLSSRGSVCYPMQRPDRGYILAMSASTGRESEGIEFGYVVVEKQDQSKDGSENESGEQPQGANQGREQGGRERESEEQEHDYASHDSYSDSGFSLSLGPLEAAESWMFESISVSQLVIRGVHPNVLAFRFPHAVTDQAPGQAHAA